MYFAFNCVILCTAMLWRTFFSDMNKDILHPVSGGSFVVEFLLLGGYGALCHMHSIEQEGNSDSSVSWWRQTDDT